ncbi:bifunctional DNA-formamidopyrimidine glycosylase/DNA-(apurinic or apyrimidinic site) lyase [Candidatus Roizmanbacteria bacterium]|nr:bifunctional DNA-formamidopyrimidine glycosylase/DNA-(apurinic or apyrimidinic site) lyase [Candidatus Roizmanbacteria bacterium]
MPELPEVETIRRSLVQSIIGKIIDHVEVREPKMIIGDPQSLIGKPIINVLRTGKVLSFQFSDSLFASIHLKLTGQLVFHEYGKKAIFLNVIPFAETNKMPGKTTQVIFYYTDGSALFFNDLRKFGWVKISNKPETPLSIDILNPKFTIDYLFKVTSSTRKPIKVLLMDQEKLAGIGNIYANDSLWEAEIHPLTPSHQLTYQDIEKLYDAIQKVIADGITSKGSSARDEVYILPNGEKGSYQNHFRVYHREDKPCLRCNSKIKRIKQAGRSSFYCPTCQIIHSELLQSEKDPQLF